MDRNSLRNGRRIQKQGNWKKKQQKQRRKPKTPLKDAKRGLSNPQASSDSDSSSSDDIYPKREPISPATAFSNQLSIFSPQKKVPKRVSRDVVVNTVFDALFVKKSSEENVQRKLISFYDDASDSDSDYEEYNEDFVKTGLTKALFNDGCNFSSIPSSQSSKKDDIVKRYIDTKLIHKLVMELRFEDFRTSSARLDILRAIYKSCPHLHIHISRALVDSTLLRWQYIQCLHDTATRTDKDISEIQGVSKGYDHGHGFIELLRFGIENLDERVKQMNLKDTMQSVETDEIIRNYLQTLINLCKTHCLDPSGNKQRELIDCVGQFTAYLPNQRFIVLERILKSWNLRYSNAPILFMRILQHVLDSFYAWDHTEPSRTLHYRIFHRLCKCIQDSHIDVAMEAIMFVGSYNSLENYINIYPKIYSMVSRAIHETSKNHWNQNVRELSEETFDKLLDYAP